jgi:hypothetical protein
MSRLIIGSRYVALAKPEHILIQALIRADLQHAHQLGRYLLDYDILTYFYIVVGSFDATGLIVLAF